MADKYELSVDVRDLLFDPCNFGIREARKWVDDHGLPTAIRFYGYENELSKLQARLSHYARESGVKVRTQRGNKAPAGLRPLTVIFENP